MLVGIHDCHWQARPSKFCQRYEAVLDHNGIAHIKVDVSRGGFWQQVLELDLFVYRWEHHDYDRQIALTIIPVIEQAMGIQCFPNMATCWQFDDKIREYFLLQQKGFSMVESWIFYDRRIALKWLETAELPLVFKLKSGSGSEHVILVKSRRAGKKLVNKMFGTGIKPNKIPIWNANVRRKHYWYNLMLHWGGNVLRALGREYTTRLWNVHKDYVIPHFPYSTGASETDLIV